MGRPAGLPQGSTIDQVMPLTVGGGLPLVAGETYQWRLRVNGEDIASRSFFVRP